jgi:hypothetical protein
MVRNRQELRKQVQFPNCGGYFDGKYIRIVKPANSGSFFHNYKKFGFVFLAIVNADYESV